MSRQEEACRWYIAEAYGLWRLEHHHSLIGLLSYARALGLDPTIPPLPAMEEEDQEAPA